MKNSEDNLFNEEFRKKSERNKYYNLIFIVETFSKLKSREFLFLKLGNIILNLLFYFALFSIICLFHSSVSDHFVSTQKK